MPTNKVKNGVIIKSTTSGICFLTQHSNFAAKTPVTKAGNTEP